MIATLPFLLALDDGSTWVRGITIFALLIVGYVVAMWIGMTVWVYRDASDRSTNFSHRVGAVGLVATMNLAGLLLYMALRPRDSLVDMYNRRLEEEAFLKEVSKDSSCPSCRRAVDADYAFCPLCTAQLQAPCAACDRSLRSEWTLCPYCAAPRSEEARPARTPVAQPTPRRAAPPRPAAVAASAPAWRASPAAFATMPDGMPMAAPSGAAGGG